jgi:hypothetical protein
MIASFALGSFDGAGLHCVTYDFDTFGRHPEVSSQVTAGLGCHRGARENFVKLEGKNPGNPLE